MATISVCMIVKNEESVLARCLNSLGQIPDEIIIVDTGSSDNTIKIARQFTDKVFMFKWCDDFSAARNFSLSYATCDYIYCADADEVLDEENRGRFMILKQALMPEIEIVEMLYSNQLSFNTTSNFDAEYRPKLFKRLREFNFIDPIHEVLRTEPIVFRSDVEIYHCPTSSHGSRDLNLLAKVVRNGEKLSSRLEMMYARELFIAGETADFEAAAGYFFNSLDDNESSEEALRRAICVTAKYASLTADTDMMLKICSPIILNNPPCEVCCALGDYYYKKGDAPTATRWYFTAFSMMPELVKTSMYKEPREGLINCQILLGESEQSAIDAVDGELRELNIAGISDI